MQNLTLQLAQVNTVKKPVDYDSQSNQVANNGSENNASFASVLKKQVNQKETTEHPNVDKTSVNQRTELAAKAASKAKQARDAEAAKQKGVVDTPKPEVQAKLETKSSAEVSVSDKDKVEDKDLSTAQATQDTLIAQMGLSAMLNTPPKIEATQKDAASLTEEVSADDTETSAELNVAVAASEDDGLSQQGNPDLSKLQSDKTTGNTSPIDAKQFPLNETKASAQTERNETALNAVDNKALPLKDVELKGLTGKELSLKESVLKDSVVSTQFARPELNATVQANASLAAQQVDKSSQISTYFGRDGWNQAVNQKVVWMVGAGDHSATLTLNPPDLGPLQVVLKMGNDHVDTTFISDNPEVRQALQDGMSMLRDKMQESGIQLGNTNVSSNEQSQRDFQQAAQNRAQQSFGKLVDNSVQDNSDDLPKQQVKQSVSNGLVDTFA
ncbi:MAG: flagellar hook-length control protein FliK [Methylophilus sp.]